MTAEAKAPIISFLNMKGGVGKSTLCFNIAYTLAKKFKKKVLVLDMDPQFNTTQALIEKFSDTEHYLGIVKEKKTILRIFQSQSSLVRNEDANGFKNEDLIINLDKNLSLICGDLDLIMIESSQRGTENLLDGFIKEINREKDFDYVFIDCPPTHSFYTTSSLIASDYYFAPVKPDVYSLLGVDLLQTVVTNVNKMNRASARCLGIIFTMVRNSTTERRIIDDVKEKYSSVKVFNSEMKYFQYNATGKLDTFMYDMATTEEEIVNITHELMEELKEK
ncbi:ParA family protein [Bacillus albus]|uniref:ParA family protein n=1 Tax=Bacillus cereus group TaxID=86661 RepID=UPI0030145916